MPANGPFSNNGTITLDQLIKISRSERKETAIASPLPFIVAIAA